MKRIFESETDNRFIFLQKLKSRDCKSKLSAYNSDRLTKFLQFRFFSVESLTFRLSSQHKERVSKSLMNVPPRPSTFNFLNWSVGN